MKAGLFRNSITTITTLLILIVWSSLSIAQVQEERVSMICAESSSDERQVFKKLCFVANRSFYSPQLTYFAYLVFDSDGIPETIVRTLNLTSYGLKLVRDDERPLEFYTMHNYKLIASNVGQLILVYESQYSQSIGDLPVLIEGVTPKGDRFEFDIVYSGLTNPNN